MGLTNIEAYITATILPTKSIKSKSLAKRKVKEEISVTGSYSDMQSLTQQSCAGVGANMQSQVL